MAKEEQRAIDDYIATGQHTRIMLRQIKGKTRLSQKEEKTLVAEAKKGNKNSRNRLAITLLHRSVAQAKRYYGPDFDDLVQDGAEAILKKVTRVKLRHLDLPIRQQMTKDVALMYKPCSIPHHLVPILSCLAKIWEQKAQELKRLPREEELVGDLERKIKKRGHFDVRENIHLWTQMLDLPLSLDLVEEIVSSSEMAVEDKEPVIKKLQAIFASPEFSDGFRAAKLTLGINGGKEQSQRLAAETLGVNQTTVSSRVRSFKKQLAGDPRVFALYQELKDLEAEDSY